MGGKQEEELNIGDVTNYNYNEREPWSWKAVVPFLVGGALGAGALWIALNKDRPIMPPSDDTDTQYKIHFVE